MFQGYNIILPLQVKGVFAALTTALMLSAAGCGSSDTTAAGGDDVTPVVSADVSQGPLNTDTASATAGASKTSNPEFDLDSFTTEGKPTKTIETPWGPREVYDPAQDEAVKAAFHKFYEDSNEHSYFGQASIGYYDEYYQIPTQPELPESLKQSFAILSNAKIQQIRNVANTKACEVIMESSCMAGWKVIPCNQSHDCEPRFSSVVNVARKGCRINNEFVYAMSVWPIGKRLKLNAYEHQPTEAEQIENFFAIECK